MAVIGFRQEGQTPIDDLSGLKLRIRFQKELDAAEYENNIKARKKYFFKKSKAKFAPFSYRWLLLVHKDMFGNVWKWAGIPRRSEKNLGFETPAYKIPFELQQLLFELHKWQQEKMPPIEIATKLHHQLVRIHPFENGNGRFGRMIADIYLYKSHLPIMTWPDDRDFVEKIFRPKYIQALRTADKGDYKELLELHYEYWKK